MQFLFLILSIDFKKSINVHFADVAKVHADIWNILKHADITVWTKFAGHPLNDISEPSENDSESQIEIESSNRPKKRAKTSNCEWFMNPKNR